MQTSSVLALVTSGLFSVAVAAISGFLAYHTARSNSRSNIKASRENLEGEIKKIKEQIEAQQAAEERGMIADLRQRYLVPLRYYAHTLSQRFEELEAKYRLDESQVRGWFKDVKDHATKDKSKDHFVSWSYYEGFFSLTTLYYTYSYLYCAHEVRFRRLFSGSRSLYSEQLDTYLARVAEAFSWETERGLWDVSQEMIGERFTRNDAKMTYAEMCDELDSEEPSRRALFFRSLDFYWIYLDDKRALDIKASLDELIKFLDSHDPQTYGLPHGLAS